VKLSTGSDVEIILRTKAVKVNIPGNHESLLPEKAAALKTSLNLQINFYYTIVAIQL
jgi:hypothetical protein